MTTDHKVFDRVKDTLVNHGNCPPELVTDAATLGQDLGLDSLDTVSFTMEVEEEFNLCFDVDFEDTDSVADVVKHVEKALTNG